MFLELFLALICKEMRGFSGATHHPGLKVSETSSSQLEYV